MAEASHPGDHIQEYLEAREWSQNVLARESGIPQGRISEIIARRRRITPALAVKLEKALELEAHIWLGLQANWDLYRARERDMELRK